MTTLDLFARLFAARGLHVDAFPGEDIIMVSRKTGGCYRWLDLYLDGGEVRAAAFWGEFWGGDIDTVDVDAITAFDALVDWLGEDEAVRTVANEVGQTSEKVSRRRSSA